MLLRIERIRPVLTVLTLMLCTVPVASAQSGAKPLGMILDVQGTVSIQRGPGKEAALPADLIFPGDQVTTSANSKVTFSFCPPSQKYSLNADSSVSIAAATIQQSKGAPATKAAAAHCTLPQVALGKHEIDHIGMMGARGAPPIAIYVGGPITATRPLFLWKHIPGAEKYKLTVKVQGGPEVWTWSHTGEASEVRMPETAPELKPGSYVWELTALPLAGNDPVGQQMAVFEVKPNPELSAMRSEAGVSQLEMAVAYENAGYFAEAATIYRALRTQTGNDPRFARNLLWLYWEAGLFEASNKELLAAKPPK